MGGKRNTWPHTHQDDIRPIVRKQESFDAGVHYDIPARTVPARGLHYCYNGVPRVGRLSGRPGNKRFTAPYSGTITAWNLNASLFSASKTDGVITIHDAQGYAFSDADVGRVLQWDDGTDDVLTGWDDGEFTTESTGDHALSAACSIRGDVHLCEWVEGQRRWLVQVGTYLFYAPWNMSSWTRICPRTTKELSETKSRYSVRGQESIIWNSAGIFMVVWDRDPPEYWKLNEPVPSVRAADTAADDYCRRVLVTFASIGGCNLAGTRVSDPVPRVYSESGSNKLDRDLVDYSKIHTNAAIAAGAGVNYTLTPTGAGRHVTHYGVWCSLDTIRGTSDDDTTPLPAANNPEVFWWNTDVPLVKPMLIARGSGDSAIYPQNWKPLRGYDKGATLKYLDASANPVTEVISNASESLPYFVAQLTTELTHATYGGLPAVIGANKLAIVSKSGTTVTILFGDTPGASDAGKLLWYEDGTYDVIRSVSGSAVTVWRSGPTMTYMVAAWDPVARSFYDETPDSELDDREGFLLQQRFLTPLPNCDVGVGPPGFLIGVQSGGENIYYCQTGEERLLGYHHEGFQMLRAQDAVLELIAFEHTVVALCRQGWGGIDLASTRQYTSEDNQESKRVPLGYLPITSLVGYRYVKGTGILGKGAVCQLEENQFAVVTNDRELRIHDGYKFGENLLAGRFMKKMELMKSGAISLHYDKRTGLLMYFKA